MEPYSHTVESAGGFGLGLTHALAHPSSTAIQVPRYLARYYITYCVVETHELAKAERFVALPLQLQLKCFVALGGTSAFPTCNVGIIPTLRS
eukprot:COSAG05_NODE_2756_length_2681_cov_0.953524_2_plen_92_part_00